MTCKHSGDLGKAGSAPLTSKPSGLTVCSRDIFTTLPEMEQAISTLGAGSGQAESQGWAGAAVMQRLSALVQPTSVIKKAKHSSGSVAA